MIVKKCICDGGNKTNFWYRILATAWSAEPSVAVCQRAEPTVAECQRAEPTVAVCQRAEPTVAVCQRDLEERANLLPKACKHYLDSGHDISCNRFIHDLSGMRAEHTGGGGGVYRRRLEQRRM